MPKLTQTVAEVSGNNKKRVKRSAPVEEDTQLLIDEDMEETASDAEMTPPVSQTHAVTVDSETAFENYNNAGVGNGFSNFPSLVPATQLMIKKTYPIVSIKRIRDDAVS